MKFHPVLRTVMFSLAIAVSLTVSLHAGDDAGEITNIAALDSGLCSVIACGENADSELPAKLAASGKMLVHGITDSPANLAKMRAVIAASKLDGYATIEMLSLNPLPYRDNLFNLIVVENPGAAKQAGLSEKEVMRVLAPRGKYCVKEEGKWKSITKEMPSDMDIWTHEYHGADGSYVSNDKQITFPLGYRWNGGLPMNIGNPNRSSKAWANTVGMVAGDGKMFTLSSAVIENTPITSSKDYVDDLYISAYDAFNGLLMWRKPAKGTFYGGLYYLNRAPFVFSENRLYAASGEGKLIEIDTATGETTRTFETAFPPVKVLVDKGVIAVAGWKDGTIVGGLHGVDRRRMDFMTEAGAVEAFDVKTGKRLWNKNDLAISFVSSSSILYMIQRSESDKREEIGRDPKLRKTKDKPKIPARPVQKVVAVDLKTGKEIWSKSSQDLGSDQYLRADCAGKDAVNICEDTGGKSFILSANDGSVLKTGRRVHVDFNVEQITKKIINEKDVPPHITLGITVCTPLFFANEMWMKNRDKGEYKGPGGTLHYYGIRGGCIVGTIPAYGLLYVPQNWCSCNPAQVEGMIATGTIRKEPSSAEMEKETPLEKGEAYSTAKQTKAPSDGRIINEWPMERADADRSNSCDAEVPSNLDIIWQTKVADPFPDGFIVKSWKESLRGFLSAPVSADGIVAVSVPDKHQVVLMEVKTGKVSHILKVGGRVDSSPVLHEGLCLFGSHDGYLYAFRCDDGKLAWRSRVAPLEERMVSYAQVESPWPVLGSVLVSDGLVFASAGKTQGSDGGIVVRAYEPQSGKLVWSKALANSETSKELGKMRINDIMIKIGNNLQIGTTRLDLATGESRLNTAYETKIYERNIQRAKQKGKDAPEVDAPPEIKQNSLLVGQYGLAYTYWPWLGRRKHSIEIFPLRHVSSFLQLCWNGDMQAIVSDPGNNISLNESHLNKNPIETSNVWSKNIGPTELKCTSVIISRNAVVAGGGCYENKQKQSGYVAVLSEKDGALMAERSFDAPLAYNGIAVTDMGMFAAFEDGTVYRLGGSKGENIE